MVKQFTERLEQGTRITDNQSLLKQLIVTWQKITDGYNKESTVTPTPLIWHPSGYCLAFSRTLVKDGSRLPDILSILNHDIVSDYLGLSK